MTLSKFLKEKAFKTIEKMIIEEKDEMRIEKTPFFVSAKKPVKDSKIELSIFSILKKDERKYYIFS